MLTYCNVGRHGTFRASKREFEIVSTTSATSTIRYRYERTTIEVQDAELRDLADDGWSDEAPK